MCTEQEAHSWHRLPTHATVSGVRRDTTPPARAAEIFVFALAIGVVNWFFPGNPGFLRGAFNPYAALSFIIAVSHGKHYGFLVLGYSAVIVAVGLPRAASITAGRGIAIP